MKFKKKFSFMTKRTSRDYFFGSYKIGLSENHVLDLYQNKFPLYDQFLPNFCSKLDNLIVDIGANIGDTSIAIFAKNKKSHIVGVEPELGFYEECIANIENNNLSDKFTGINKFISTEKGNFSVKISDNNSTGSKVENSSNNDSSQSNTISIEELIDLIPGSFKDGFDLLKIDTDGYDWDVLMSFVDYAKNNSFMPRFIFFEMQTFLNNNEFEIVGRDKIIENYDKSMIEIAELGFNNFCLFDNFGTFFKKTKSLNEIFELNNYIKRSQINNKNSTVFYFDVLAYSSSEEEKVDLFLSEFYL